MVVTLRSAPPSGLGLLGSRPGAWGLSGVPGAPGTFAVPLALGVLAREGAVWGRGTGLSMAPLIRPGDELRLASLDGKRIFRGMLVAYPREARLVIHRVIACHGTGLVAKGDASPVPDPEVPRDQVVGRVVALRGPAGRSVDLEAFPWPFMNRLLGACAWLGSRLSPADPAPSLPWRLAWKALRLPFYLARLLVP